MKGVTHSGGRRRRLEELKHIDERPHYGSVHGIEAAEFVPEVSNAGDDVWVLVHLYKDACVPCPHPPSPSSYHLRPTASLTTPSVRNGLTLAGPRLKARDNKRPVRS